MPNVDGTTANDTLTAGAGDVVSAGAGDDLILVQGGDNQIDGGPGTDTIDYRLTESYAGSGVLVLLNGERVFSGGFRSTSDRPVRLVLG